MGRSELDAPIAGPCRFDWCGSASSQCSSGCSRPSTTNPKGYHRGGCPCRSAVSPAVAASSSDAAPEQDVGKSGSSGSDSSDTSGSDCDSSAASETQWAASAPDDKELVAGFEAEAIRKGGINSEAKRYRYDASALSPDLLAKSGQTRADFIDEPLWHSFFYFFVLMLSHQPAELFLNPGTRQDRCEAAIWK